MATNEIHQNSYMQVIEVVRFKVLRYIDTAFGGDEGRDLCDKHKAHLTHNPPIMKMCNFLQVSYCANTLQG